MLVCLQANKWRGRNFEGVLSLTHDNKVHYAEMHGYTYEDASWIVSGAALGSKAELNEDGRTCLLQNCIFMWPHRSICRAMSPPRSVSAGDIA